MVKNILQVPKEREGECELCEKERPDESLGDIVNKAGLGFDHKPQLQCAFNTVVGRELSENDNVVY